MYTVVEGSTVDIFFVYLVVFGACILLSPFSNFIVNAIARGLNKWR